MSVKDDDNGPAAQDGNGVTGMVLAAVVAAAFLPLLAGWKLTPLFAEQGWAWRTRWAGAVSVALGLASMLALWTWRDELAQAVLPPSWATAVVLLSWWAALTPWGALVVVCRLPLFATALSEGRAHPVRADRWRRAIWSGSSRRSAHAAMHRRDDPQAIGVVVRDDRRDLVTKTRDNRDAGRNAAQWLDKSLLVLPPRPPRLALFGASGFGKTWTLHRVVNAALNRGWRVAYFDGKGRAEDAEQLMALAASVAAPTVWWRSRNRPGGCPFDAWQGDGSQLVAKALALMGQGRITAQSSDAAKHYRRQNLGTLAAVLGDRPWTTAFELLERLRNPAPWVTDGNRLSDLKVKDKASGRPEHLRVAAALATNLDSVGTTLDGGSSGAGWCWDEGQGTPWQLAVITVNAAEGAASLLPGSVMLADLAAYLNDEARRTPAAKPLLVIMDEAQTMLDNPDTPEVAQAFEQMRSAGAGIIVACQSVQGLGEQGERIIRAGADFLIGNMAEAEDLVALAGTVKAVEVAHQGTRAGHTLTGQTAAREQAQQRLDPDRLREAPTGVFALVERGRPVVWTAVCPSLVSG